MIGDQGQYYTVDQFQKAKSMASAGNLKPNLLLAEMIMLNFGNKVKEDKEGLAIKNLNHKSVV